MQPFVASYHTSDALHSYMPHVSSFDSSACSSTLSGTAYQLTISLLHPFYAFMCEGGERQPTGPPIRVHTP